MPDIILFSVVTPTWNRSSYLLRVHDGLKKQTYKCFEWIVADDGSTDDTESVVRELAARSDFPVIYIRSNIHTGKIRMDNEAVRYAKGHLILWCDSDDWFVPNTLLYLKEAWCSIPIDERKKFVGLTALSATREGIVTSSFPDKSINDISWNELAYIYNVKGDLTLCTRADLLKAHPFMEVDLVIPESAVWTTIGNLPTKIIDKVLTIKEYQSIHSISFNKTMNYNRGRAYATAITVKNLKNG